jgi:ATP-binding cassette subfamily B protein
MERLFGLMAQHKEVADSAGARPLSVRAGEVRFDQVTFSYDPRRPILRSLSLVLPAGKTTAVVGSSGAGKSTLSRLLYRFYDVQSGQILIDGQDIREVTNENTNMRFNGIMPKPKDVAAPPNRNPYMNWDWDKVEAEGFQAHKETFEKLPKWIQKKCAESQEFKKYAGSYVVEGTYPADEQDNEQEAPPAKTVKDEW